MSNVIYSLKGVGGAQVDVYEDRVEIIRKGLFCVGPRGTKSIPLGAIISVQVKQPGLNAGFISFGVATGGDVINTNLADYNIFKTVSNDPNTVIINSRGKYRTAEQIRSYIEERISELRQSNTVVNQATSSADEIRKYKALLNDGIISQEEYEEKKKMLLG